ncbi:MAG: transcriptional regulator GcvA [Gammaproteobacteria bacterium]
MSHIPYRLPPLNSLRQFEAAGRHLSFRLAAGELNVTPSAVSHGVQALEAWLGIALFTRSHRGLDLTSAGARYLPQVRDALEILARATEDVPGRSFSGQLSISTAPGFASNWLIPRLPRFREKYPDIEVSLDTSHRQIDFLRDGMDLAIRMGRGDWPGLYTDCLVREELVPICAPQLAQSIHTPADLMKQTLLHVTDVTEDWVEWASLAGVEGLDLDRGLRFDSIDMAWRAAAQGLGVAIGRLPLVTAYLQAGHLAPILSDPQPCQTGYWLVASHEVLARPEVTSLHNWLRTEFKEPKYLV